MDAFILAVSWCSRPMSRNYDDSDQGVRGVRSVKMTPPLRARAMPGASVFLLTSLVVSALIVGLKRPNLGPTLTTTWSPTSFCR